MRRVLLLPCRYVARTKRNISRRAALHRSAAPAMAAAEKKGGFFDFMSPVTGLFTGCGGRESKSGNIGGTIMSAVGLSACTGGGRETKVNEVDVLVEDPANDMPEMEWEIPQVRSYY